MSTFENLTEELDAQSIDTHASELHGMLIGYTCTLKHSQASERRARYSEWIGREPSSILVDILDSAFASALDNLEEYSNFEFRLLLPIETAPISERVASLALWCSGFLSGLGELGNRLVELEGLTNEALADLARIAALTDEVPEGEDNEVDLVEIEEFVRVSVLLIFSEIHAGSR
ncbi:MAG TPA: hypothetical protein DEQ32_08570 [Gammaproteobacteria bacterium]|nr:hypothetical protein [Gammaproteobacteria bacterium]|tara:strand:- start:684 stop:1208 length:525 start_codon:yes stop_codon:yes gene_type:complete